ncbi:MAG: SH3 domain-containing protein [Paludibacteraceae bacterium]|nr:SH3 domain-containing protein [Paludibacteraceae bacterium]
MRGTDNCGYMKNMRENIITLFFCCMLAVEGPLCDCQAGTGSSDSSSTYLPESGEGAENVKQEENPDYASRYGRVVDKDGYVNLREGADPKSRIIGTIPSNEVVQIIEMTEKEIDTAKMLRVRTKDGRKGYVHTSRLEKHFTEDEAEDEALFEKVSPMLKKKVLSIDEYEYVFASAEALWNNASLGYGMAWDLYNHFCKNKVANKQILKMNPSQLEKHLPFLVEYMGLPLFVGNDYFYHGDNGAFESDNRRPFKDGYNRVIADFPMFAGNRAVKERLIEMYSGHPDNSEE